MARHFEPVLDITCRFLRRQSFQMLHHCNALQQLRQTPLPQFLRELGLPGQNDLQQFGVRRLEVRKQPDCFEHGIVQVLRLIDDQDKSLAGQHFSKQHFVQLVVHGHESHARRVDP